MGPRAGTYAYARWEFERRFLAAHLPAGAAVEDVWDVFDRYLEGSRLRLRRMDAIDGSETVFKLGKKEVPAPPDFSRMTITTIYLTREEYELLLPLPGLELRKRRHKIEEGGRLFSVDVFGGALAGLVLAETDFESAEGLEQQIELPEWIERDVSDDERLTGGALARLSEEERAALVRELGR
jgi:CYTH domain-containing protein